MFSSWWLHIFNVIAVESIGSPAKHHQKGNHIEASQGFAWKYKLVIGLCLGLVVGNPFKGCEGERRQLVSGIPMYLHHFASDDITFTTTDTPLKHTHNQTNCWGLVHTKISVWPSHWLVTIGTFYRHILFLWRIVFSFFWNFRPWLARVYLYMLYD